LHGRSLKKTRVIFSDLTIVGADQPPGRRCVCGIRRIEHSCLWKLRPGGQLFSSLIENFFDFQPALCGEMTGFGQLQAYRSARNFYTIPGSFVNYMPTAEYRVCLGRRVAPAILRSKNCFDCNGRRLPPAGCGGAKPFENYWGFATLRDGNEGSFVAMKRL